MRQTVVQTLETITKIFEFETKKVDCEKMPKFIVQLWHDLLRRVFEIVVVQLIKSNRTAITFVPQTVGRSGGRAGGRAYQRTNTIPKPEQQTNKLPTKGEKNQKN